MNNENANTKEITLKHVLIVVACGIISLWLLGLGFWMSTSIIGLIFIAGYFLEAVEPDAALKRYVKYYSKVIATVAVAIVFVLMTDVVLGIPLAQLIGWTLQGKSATNVPLWATLEVLIIGVSGYMAYATMYGQGKARRWLAVAVGLLLVVCLWQIKAPANPVGRWFNGQFAVHLKAVGEAASQLEEQVKPEWGVSTTSVRLYRQDDAGRYRPVTSGQLPEGQLVQFLPEVRKDDAGCPMRLIRLMDQTGDYKNGPQYWVDATPSLFNRGVDPAIAVANAKPSSI